MAKISLKVPPTFSMSVAFPIAGAAPVPVQLTFRHRTRTELAEFMDSKRKRLDTDIFMDMVTAWDLEDEFTRDNVDHLLDNHIGVPVTVFNAYVGELTKTGVSAT